MEGDARLGGRCYASRGTGHRVAGVTGGSICDPNPCGVEAVCNIGSDRSGKTRPVCTCP